MQATPKPQCTSRARTIPMTMSNSASGMPRKYPPGVGRNPGSEVQLVQHVGKADVFDLADQDESGFLHHPA